MGSHQPVIREAERNCPSCGRTFQADQEVCPDDGARLVDHTLRAKPKDDAMVGRVLGGKYRVESVLGRGGMGVVYQGSHTMLGKRVAIKVLRGQFDDEVEILSRFTQEARAASAIGSAHIVDVTDFGELEEGAAYFVMEYLEGEPLSAFMKRTGPAAPERAVSIVEQICRALAAAHSHGIVHRDLKPDNVFLVRREERDDFVKILDFGIAKVAGAAGPRTRSGVVFGTPHYMAPEQAAGDPVDGRTDVYALGVILFELLVGKVPFDADSFMAILSKHMYQEPPTLVSIRPDPSRPPRLDEIVIKAMSKKPDERWQSMEELRAALLAAVPLAGTGGLLVGSGPRPIETAPMRATDDSVAVVRSGRGAKVALVMALSILLGGAGFFAYQRSARPPLVGSPLGAPLVPGPSPPPVVLPPAPPPVLAPPTSELPAPPPPAAPVARVRIVTTPAGATVWDGETSLGTTPFELDRPGVPRALVVRAAGRQDEAVTIGPETGEVLELALRPARASRPGGGGGAGGGGGGGGGGSGHTTQDGELRNPFGP